MGLKRGVAQALEGYVEAASTVTLRLVFKNSVLQQSVSNGTFLDHFVSSYIPCSEGVCFNPYELLVMEDAQLSF